MSSSDQLKYCFHGQHSRPLAEFKTLPGTKQKRQVCALCYQKIMTDRKKHRVLAK